MGAWLERVVFSGPEQGRPCPLPFGTGDFPTRQVLLTEQNFRPALQASCSIPFLLQAVHDIPGAPPGAYWDGGITDYHLHLDYASMDEGLVLYPHFQRKIIPGYLDTMLPRRRHPDDRLANVVVLAPDPDWVRRALPHGKLPDLDDFKAYAGDLEGRIAVWSRAVAESQRLAEEFDAVLRQGPFDALPLE